MVSETFPDLNNMRQLARTLSMVENELKGYESILQQLRFDQAPPIIGLTGPPGAGKSTLLAALLENLNKTSAKVAILAVDPTSPFNYGALLGDRIRLSAFYTNPNIYIRSVATRGSLGGLSDKIIEMVDVLRAASFDYIFVETVGVGQSEVEIAGLADTTVVVLVPEAGDEIQTMKAGLMEIADIFVVNKADREAANKFAQNLRKLVHERAASQWSTPVIPTIATEQKGIEELIEQIMAHHTHHKSGVKSNKRPFLLTEKVLRLIRKKRMADIDRQQLFQSIKSQHQSADFNIYSFAKKWI